MNRLALDLRVPVTRIADMVAELRAVTTDTAPCVWLATSKRRRNSGLIFYDLQVAEDDKLAKIERDVQSLEALAR